MVSVPEGQTMSSKSYSSTVSKDQRLYTETASVGVAPIEGRGNKVYAFGSGGIVLGDRASLTINSSFDQTVAAVMGSLIQLTSAATNQGINAASGATAAVSEKLKTTEAGKDSVLMDVVKVGLVGFGLYLLGRH